MDGPPANPALGTVRARGALDVLQRPAARPALVRCMRRGVVVFMPSREDLGTAHTEPPLDGVTLAPGSRIPPGRQRCRPGAMGGSGISPPCGTRSWCHEGCIAPSASPSLAPL